MTIYFDHVNVAVFIEFEDPDTAKINAMLIFNKK